MDIRGELLYGGSSVTGAGPAVFAVEQTTGNKLEPAFAGADASQVEAALAAAWAAFASYRETTLTSRATFLETIADKLLELGDGLVERAVAETGLPSARIVGERLRTANQLRMFAEEVRSGGFQELRFDPADPNRQPVPKPDLRLRNIPLGPVAVFGASNFPLAFSVAGGDSASALAAGCPVIVKAHSAHPGTSELVGRAVQAAVAECDLHPGLFSLLFGSGAAVGQTLVADARIRAVGFTGSRQAGVSLMDIASKRKQPIPVYAEMSSINPVILFPHALAARADKIAQSFVASLTLGAGQFCTNPGLILAIDSPGLQTFVDGASAALSNVDAQTMLTSGICDAFRRGVEKLGGKSAVTRVAEGRPGGAGTGQAALFVVEARDFLTDHSLQEEVFGAASLVVRCRDHEELRKTLASLEGQLTVSLHIDEDDYAQARGMVPDLEMLAGRLLVNGFGTGVEVSPAMVHGGPFPATSDGRSTSVGTMAISRFLRPVSYQDFPFEIIPTALR